MINDLSTLIILTVTVLLLTLIGVLLNRKGPKIGFINSLKYIGFILARSPNGIQRHFDYLDHLEEKKKSQKLSSDDVKNIKTLLAHLSAIVDFLSSRKDLPKDLVYKFRTHRGNISRILDLSGLEVYFERYITANELNSLLIIIELSDEIIKIGTQKSSFLSGKEHVAQLQYLINKVTRHHQRWIGIPTK